MTNDNNPWGNNSNNSKVQDNKIDDLLRKFYKSPNLKGPNVNFSVKQVVILLIAICILWMLSGFYIVQPDESAVELVFGKCYDITSPGLNYNFPGPIGKVFKVKTATVQKEEVGFKNDKRRSNVNPGIMLTGDENIVNITFEVQWKVSDPYKYLFNVRDDYDSRTISSASESAMREAIGQNSINFIMVGEGRSKVATETHDLIQKTLDSYDMGVDVLSVQLIKVDPPEKVIDAFRDVQSAKADKEREVNQAQAFYNDKIPRSRGEANSIIKNAEAYKEEVISNSKGEVSRFHAIYDEYKNNKEITKQRIYIENLEAILQKLDKIIVDKGSNIVPYLPMHDLLKK